MESLKTPTIGRNRLKRVRPTINDLNFKPQTSIKSVSNHLIKVIESATSEDHKDACLNMVDNSKKLLTAIGYEKNHLNAWQKSMVELVGKEELPF